MGWTRGCRVSQEDGKTEGRSDGGRGRDAGRDNTHTHTHVTLTLPAKVKAVKWRMSAFHRRSNRSRTEDVSSFQLPSAVYVHRGVFGAAASICGGVGGCQAHVLWLLRLPLKIWSAAVGRMTHPSLRYGRCRPSVHRLLITTTFPVNEGGGGGKHVHAGSVHVYEEKPRHRVLCDPAFPSHNDPEPRLFDRHPSVHVHAEHVHAPMNH